MRPAETTLGRTRRRTRIEPSLVIALVGLTISSYLTIEHYSSSALLACPENSTINCAKVTTSAWSHILAIPVAVLGLAYFLVMTVLVIPAAWRRRALDPFRIAASGIGVLMVLYLIWIELFRVNAICLWCTGVHVCTVLLLGAVLWRTSNREPPGR